MMREINVEVSVCVDDILEDATIAELQSELSSRKALYDSREQVRVAIDQIRRGDTADAITTLEREFWPKWASIEDSKAAFKAANENKEAAPASAVAA